MPATVDEIVRRRVVQLWLSGEARDKIAAENNIGAGTVSAIVDNYKIGLDNLDFASFRELMVEAKKRGMTPSELASHFRLFHYLFKSGAAEDKIESFITNINSGYIPLEKAIELVNQLYDVSKKESIPLEQVTGYIKQKLEEKEKIDEVIKEADAVLQSKNVSVETINEYMKLNEKLNEYNLSFQDVENLVNVLVNVKECEFDGKKIIGKLKKIQRLQNKEERLKHHCEILSGQVKKCNNVLPLAQNIKAMNIDIRELLVFDSTVNQLAKKYNLPPYIAALPIQ